MVCVAVVLPSYCPDEGKLYRALESVYRVNTDSVLVTAIVVDDGSPSRYREMYERLLAEFPATVLLENQSNHGVGVTRNSGIDYALRCREFDALSFLDADDCLLEGWDSLPKSLVKDDAHDLYTSGYLRNTVEIGVRRIESLSEWVDYPFTCINSIFFKLNFLREMGVRFESSMVGEDTTFIIQSLTYGKWRHFPIMSSFYDYDYKDHVIYPHPLATFVLNHKSALADNGALDLYSYALIRNERNGLLLRVINPRQAIFTSFPGALFLYCVGLRFRKIIKMTMKMTPPWFARYF